MFRSSILNTKVFCYLNLWIALHTWSLSAWIPGISECWWVWRRGLRNQGKKPAGVCTSGDDRWRESARLRPQRPCKCNLVNKFLLFLLQSLKIRPFYVYCFVTNNIQRKFVLIVIAISSKTRWQNGTNNFFCYIEKKLI